jgi:HlyD family secretion protein
MNTRFASKETIDFHPAQFFTKTGKHFASYCLYMGEDRESREQSMLDQPPKIIWQHSRHVLQTGSLTDDRLVERFLEQQDQAAFELLVWRHGPMVLRVCRRVLRNSHSAEDAFQAVFLTLATKAEAIGKRESVGNWLYKVAFRIALRARDGSTRRATRERPLADSLVADQTGNPAEAAAWRELGPLLDAEVNRLPEKYRAAFILCCMQGKTNEEAATELGCPKGTVLSRLARARERLRERLNRRGLALSGAVFPFIANPNAWPLVKEPVALVQATVQSALRFMKDPSAASAVTEPVARLLDAGARGSRWGWRKLVAAAILAALFLGGIGSVWFIDDSSRGDGWWSDHVLEFLAPRPRGSSCH